MTPKEKAEELFEKYYRLFNNFPNYQYVLENLNTIQDEKLYTAKQCALIAIDEMIEMLKELERVGFLKPNSAISIIEEIKQEIENL